MLCYLSVKNIVLIEELSLDFKSGLTVLTGETGAGKSMSLRLTRLSLRLARALILVCCAKALNVHL